MGKKLRGGRDVLYHAARNFPVRSRCDWTDADTVALAELLDSIKTRKVVAPKAEPQASALEVQPKVVQRKPRPKTGKPHPWFGGSKDEVSVASEVANR